MIVRWRSQVTPVKFENEAAILILPLLSEERSARFLSRRERFNASDAAMLVGCTEKLVYLA
jgi:hypothetical protein